MLLKLRLFLIGLVSLLWIGCSTEQMRNITGSLPVNSYSVIQGLVSGDSIISRSNSSSLSKIAFEDGTLVDLRPSNTLDPKKDYSDNNSIIEESLDNSPKITVTDSITIDVHQQEADSDGLFTGEPKRVSLVTDAGIILQSLIFDKYTATGKLLYRFAGDFPEDSIRLRILEEDRILEVAIGRLKNSDEIIDVPELDLVNSALATRMIEQTKQYGTLKNKGISSFVESMNSVIKLRINENPSKNLLIENINRVGINDEGNFEIYPTSYDPFKHRNPNRAKDWEKQLFDQHTTMPSELDKSDSEIKEDTVKKLTVKKELINWVMSVTSNPMGMNREIELFKDLDFSPQKVSSINGKTLNLKIYFKESLPVEFRNSVLMDGVLKIQNGDSHSELPLTKINSRFQNSQVLELGIDVSNLFTETSNRIIFIFFQHTFPDFRVDQIAQAFFKVGLESN